MWLLLSEVMLFAFEGRITLVWASLSVQTKPTVKSLWDGAQGQEHRASLQRTGMTPSSLTAAGAAVQEEPHRCGVSTGEMRWSTGPTFWTAVGSWCEGPFWCDPPYALTTLSWTLSSFLTHGTVNTGKFIFNGHALKIYKRHSSKATCSTSVNMLSRVSSRLYYKMKGVTVQSWWLVMQIAF